MKKRPGMAHFLSITVQPVFSLTTLDSVVSVGTNYQIFSCLVESDPTKPAVQ